MGATPRSGALAPESLPPPLSAGASAAPSAIDPPHARLGVWREGLPGRECVFPVGLGKRAGRGAPSDAIIRASTRGGRSLVGAEPRVPGPVVPLSCLRGEQVLLDSPAASGPPPTGRSRPTGVFKKL